jgi:hypothetical protein
MANASLPSPHWNEATASSKRSKSNDQILFPDAGGDVVGPNGLRHDEPSRTDGRLSDQRRDRPQTKPNSEIRLMTKFFALIAACAVFAPVALSVMTQAAQIVA